MKSGQSTVHLDRDIYERLAVAAARLGISMDLARNQAVELLLKRTAAREVLSSVFDPPEEKKGMA